MAPRRVLSACLVVPLAAVSIVAVSAPVSAEGGEAISTELELPGASVDDLEPFEPETPSPTADVAVDRWLGVPGQSLADVAAGSPPSETFDQFGDLESEQNFDNDYAVRMRTLLTPTETGLYRFWVSGDDDMRLFLNPEGDDPAGARRIAYVAGWSTYQQWNRFWSQRSVWFELEAGVPYYLETIGKEGSGDDHFSVAWERDGGFARELVPAAVLETTQLGSGGWRTATPVGLPGLPAAMTDPQWNVATGSETIAIGWAAVDGADWYEVRLEGAGQERTVVVESDPLSPDVPPFVTFDNLVPDTRYLIEVAPASAAGRQPEVGRVVVTELASYPAPIQPVGGVTPTVTYDQWDTGWWTLTSVPFGYAPFSTTTLTTGLEAPIITDNNRATRLRALITPTRTDSYTFHLSGDDDARLLFNAAGPWAHGAVPVAYVSGWTEQYQWDRYDSQASPTFELVAGESYYIEAIGVHGIGLDHLEVGWSTPGSEIAVVPAEVLTPTMSGAGGWREDANSLAVAPGAVRELGGAWATSEELTASWQPPIVDDDHGMVAHYVVQMTGAAIDQSEITTDPSMVVSGLEPGSTLTITVIAVNEAGAGAPVTTLIDVPVATPTTTSSTTTSTSTTMPDDDTTTTSTSSTTTTTSTTTTSTTTSTTSTTTSSTTLAPATASLRVTFMCRAVDGGDITNDDDVGERQTYPPGSYIWRVRSENDIGPVEYAVRVGGANPFRTGVLEARETQFFASGVGHSGATIHWPGGSNGTASANENECGVNDAPTTSTTTTTTTTTTTMPIDGECTVERPGVGNQNGLGNGNGQGNANGHGGDCDDPCTRPGVGNQDGLGNGNGQGNAYGHGCDDALVEAGKPPVPLDDDQIDAAAGRGKQVGKGWRG